MTGVSPLVASRLEPMVAMLACKPIFGRLFVQKSGHVFDLGLRAMAHELPIALGNLYGFENHMRVSHLVNMRREPIVFQCVSPVLWRKRHKGPLGSLGRLGRLICSTCGEQKE